MSLASSINGESTQKTRRESRLQVSSSSEAASIITESLARPLRVIDSSLGHNVERLLIIDATATMGEPSANKILILTTVGERNKGMKGITASLVTNLKVLSLGRRGSLGARSCSARSVSEAVGFSEAFGTLSL